MHTRYTLMTGAALAALSAFGPLAGAAELQDPLPLLTSGLVANPSPGSGCTPAAATGRVDDFLAVVRNSSRPDVGPYTVTLPGYASSIANTGNDTYRPYLLQANAGETIRFDLVNQLTVADETNNPFIDRAETIEANVHFHGLIVSPHSNSPAATPCALPGDYVFAQTDPSTTTSYRVDVPATLPGRLLGATNTPTAYPAGLTWFHAHIHGKTMDDITSGQAGLVSIGDTVGSLLATPGIPAADMTALQATTTKYLALRDIQLAAPAASDPAIAPVGTPATWLRGATSEFDFQACREGSFPTPVVAGSTNVSGGNGWCGHSGLRYINASVNHAHDNANGTSPDTRWLFTVNGQLYPTITVAAGKNHLWRVANLSDTQSYVLQLTDDSTGQLQPMQVVTLDGVVAGTSGDPASTNKQLGVNLRQILMLPATRAEVFIPNSATTADRGLTLSTAGAATGVNLSANPSFDNYQGINTPAVNLAHVVMKAGQTSATQPLSITLAGAAATTQANTRGLAATSTAAFAAPPTNCIALPQYGGTSYGFRRRIDFAVGGNLAFGSEIINAATGKNIDTSLDGNGAAAHTIPQTFFPMADMTNPSADRHICPRLGEQEVWELVNYSNEMHNFHIHQAKFRLSVPGDRGVPPGYTAAAAITDPNNMIAAMAPEVAGQTPVANVDVWHDTLPVPPASTAGVPGRVFVTIPFRAQQQVGSYVYHCHILYHEDLGMMAVVQVYDPLAPTRVTDNSIDDVIRASMCTAPGSAVLPTPGESLMQRLRTMVASPT